MRKSPLKRAQTQLSRSKPLKSSGKGLNRGTKTLNKGNCSLNKATKLKRGIKSPEQVQVAKNEQELMWNLFRKIWSERPHVSQASGTYLGEEPLSVYFDHLLDKGIERYKHLKYEKDNIYLITWEEHANKYTNPHPNHKAAIEWAHKRFNV